MREVQAGDYCGYSFAFEVTKNNTKLAVVDIGYGDGILRTRAKHEALINGKRYPIRALMMSHMFVEVDGNVHAQDEVILYNNDIRIDEYTFKGVGANSEQLSAMNHDSLKRSTFQMTVKYNQNGELTMDGISLKRLHKALVHLPLFMMNYKLENRCAVTIAHLKIVD